MNLYNCKSDCCGCTACSSICKHDAIKMVPDSEGFLYPEVNKTKCVDCSLCSTVCPVKYRDTTELKDKPLAVYAMHHRDKTVWEKSASGGAFGALSDYILSMGGVVFGARFTERWDVEHAYAENPEEAIAFRGSKYVQSDMNTCYKQIKQFLTQGRLVLFSGTPCQVEGLNTYLKKKYENLITCDIICNSVPSPTLFSDWISFLTNKYGEITAINMKDKGNGWSRGGQSPRIRFQSGKEIFGSSDSMLWNKIFSSKLAMRPACYKCRFTNFQRPSDFTIGDFWHIEKMMPEYNNPLGVSAICVNTQKGLDIFESIKDSIDYRVSDISQLAHSKFRRPISIDERKRELFFAFYSQKGFLNTINRYWGTNIFQKIRKKILLTLHKM